MNIGEREKSNLQNITYMYKAGKVQRFPDAEDLSVEDFLKLKEHEEAVLVDVRTEEERAVSMIPDAIDVGSFEKDAEKYKESTVVFYCLSGMRSGEYSLMAKDKVKKCLNIVGGILAWVNSGQTVVNGDQETKRVCLHGAPSDILPTDYEAV